MKRSLAVSIMMMAVLCTASFASRAMEAPMKVDDQIKKFAPVKIRVDGGLLNERQRMLVDELVMASRYMDRIFMRQVYGGNSEIESRLAKSKGKDKAIYDYFEINFGPFDRLNHNESFVDGVAKKPLGANFYPEDMTKGEFERWVKLHPADKQMFESNFTVIRRKGKDLVAVPYSVEYKDLLIPAAEHLRKAAKYVDNESLKKYLESRADAFLSNDYYQSDVDWVRMKGHDIEVVIGPYEVYEDGLFGYKAAFESFVTRVDPKESERLAKVVAYLGELEKNLPIDDEYRGQGRSLSSPIIVAQEIYTAGDTRAGVQTIAFNLPNDEKVRKEEGSKKVMLKNVQNAKFEKILKPIAKKVLAPKDFANVDFEAFFAQTLLHEVSHGIGPGEIKKGGKATTVNKELRDLYSIIEEAKADVLGAYNNSFLIGKGLYSKDFERVLWPTYLAGIFRSVRFGISEAHGGANAIQFNYLMEKGAIARDEKSGQFTVVADKIGAGIRDLAKDLLMIEAKGDYGAAKRFIEKYSKIHDGMKEALAKLVGVPVDIRPVYAYK